MHGAQGTRQVVMMAGQRGERDKGMDSGLGVIKRNTTAEPRRDSVGVGDDTRGEYGACDVHRAGMGGAYDVRADGVGVLDNGEHDAMAEPQIHKTSMELVMYTGRAREGHMGCEVTEWELEISVKHLVTHGARETRRMEIIAEEWRGSVTPVW